MKTAKEINNGILTTTRMIAETHPELLKYIDEMPVKIFYTRDNKVDGTSLMDYHESLKSLITRYSEYEHAQEVNGTSVPSNSFHFRQI